MELTKWLKVNPTLAGWANYFQVGTVSGANSDAVAPLVAVQAQNQAAQAGLIRSRIFTDTLGSYA